MVFASFTPLLFPTVPPTLSA